MKLFIHYIVIVGSILGLLQGCVSEEAKPQYVTHSTTQENNQSKKVTPQPSQSTQKKSQGYKLFVKAPKNARIRILNIKPKYHDNIELNRGKYLIEVTKHGYKKYKKWVHLNKDLLLNVQLQTFTNPFDTRYFQFVTKIEWRNHHELFSLHYDAKSQLIWAMQSAYIDYVLQKKPQRILRDTLFAKGTPWPKIYKTKIDTLIYNGYFRYRGRNFLFKNKNELLRYKAGLHTKTGKKVAQLSKLRTNAMVNYWRLPKLKEVRLSNPFYQYQKYFQVHYSRYKDVHFNLPILCTRLKKNKYYSNCSVAYAYNKDTGLYDGARIEQLKHTEAKDGLYFALNHAKNFALVTPVRAITTEYDKIIFHTKISPEQKLAALTTLLIKEHLEKKHEPVKKIANAMASKAMQMIFGDPKIYGGALHASSNRFTRKLPSFVHKQELHKVILKVKKQHLYLQSYR